MKPIIHIDASALRESACMLRFYQTVFSGWRQRATSNDIVYGNAIHKYVETMYKTGDRMQAFAAVNEPWTELHVVKDKKKHLSPQHSLIVATMFWEWLQNEGFQLAKGPDGAVFSEHKFSLPYKETDNAIYMLTGTIDIIAEVNRGVCFIADIKTTSTYDADRFLEAFQLDVQLKLYSLAIHLAARHKPDSIYAHLISKGFGAQILGVFLNPAPEKVVFKRSRLFFYKESDLAELQFLIDKTIDSLDKWVGTGRLPPREGSVNGACKTPYGACRFFNACASPDEITARALLERSLKQEHYDPTKFR